MPENISLKQIYDRLYSDPEKCAVWDSLWNNKSIGRIAVCVSPNAARIEAQKNRFRIKLNEVTRKPANWAPHWDDAILEQLYGLLAADELNSDCFPALHVPRDVHGESQGICDIFGAEVELQDIGHMYVHPLAPDPAHINDIVPLPITRSRYYGAVDWVRYASEATGGIACRFPVMTGPIDTANYLLGTTVLMEWLYTQPDTVHRLLHKITSTIIQMATTLRKAAGGVIHSHHFLCTRGGFDFCSEVRSLVSLEMYEEYEAPYLRRIGEAMGPYGIHSCGNWERTIPSAISDPNLRVMNGQIRENDLRTLCDMAAGKITLSIGPSVCVHDRFMWDDMEDFYRHIIRNVPLSQPFEIGIAEKDLDMLKMGDA